MCGWDAGSVAGVLFVSSIPIMVLGMMVALCIDAWRGR